MSKIARLSCVAFLMCAMGATNNEFKNFHAVEAYEIQPGILILPNRSSDGRVCNIVIEKRHYSSNSIDIDAVMSHDQLVHIFDQLVPKPDRGLPSLDHGDGGELTTTSGVSTTTFLEYQNVSLEMVGKTNDNSEGEYAVALIHLKKTNCK